MSWTRDRVVGAMRRWHEDRGVPPRKRDWAKPTFDSSGQPLTPPADVVLELFGKWSEAVRAAGIDAGAGGDTKKRRQKEIPDRAQREYVDDDLYYAEGGEGAQQSSYSPAGTYLAAAEVIAEMHRWTALQGAPPTEKEWLRDKAWPHPDVVVDLFGSWADAIRDAGLDSYVAPPRGDEPDVAELRNRMRELETQLQQERADAERELRAARRDASRADERARAAEAARERGEEVVRRAREEAARAREEAARTLAEAASPQQATAAGEAAVHEMEALNARLLELEERAERLAEENDGLRRAMGQIGATQDPSEPDPDEPLPEPRSVADAVQIAADRVTSLVLLPDAFDSAEDSPFRRPQLVLDALLKLDQLSQLYAQPEGIGESIGAVARQLGLDWVPDTTDWGGTRGRHYEVSWDGRKYRLGPHVRLGTGAGAGSTARIYGFFHDGDDEHGRCFVVGHVGRHLPDSTT